MEAVWDAEVPEDRLDPGSLTIAITTMNRPDFCGKLLAQIGSDRGVHGPPRRGARDGAGHPEGRRLPAVPGAQAALGDKLRVIEQGNIGGSGGYARGQYEAVRKGTATYVMMMDDDVVCEPESIIRAVTFADLAKRPTIVGGHMFSIYDRSVLHSFGEIVQRYKFWWRSPATVMNDWDFAARNLRSSRWLHRRIDVDFNGWFMCLIPMQTLREIGLSLPLFIKWDDSEFGLRAGEAGYPTVTFPGAAVWHIPWTDKNDALDWQAYFHHRNRLDRGAAALAVPAGRVAGPRELRAPRSSTWSRCSTPPSSCGTRRSRTCSPVRSGCTRRCRRSSPRSTPSASSGPTRCSRRTATRSRPSGAAKPPRRDKDDTEVPRRTLLLVTAALAPDPAAEQGPPAVPGVSRRRRSPAMDAKWYRLASYDSAVVSMPDGTSAALYQRDPEHFRDLLRRTVEIHERLYREWPQLAAALPRRARLRSPRPRGGRRPSRPPRGAHE